MKNSNSNYLTRLDSVAVPRLAINIINMVMILSSIIPTDAVSARGIDMRTAIIIGRTNLLPSNTVSGDFFHPRYAAVIPPKAPIIMIIPCEVSKLIGMSVGTSSAAYTKGKVTLIATSAKNAILLIITQLSNVLCI